MVKGNNKHNNENNNINNNNNDNESRKKQKIDNNSNISNNSSNNNNDNATSNKLTLSEVLSNEITKISSKNWLKQVNTETFDIKLVEKIYNEEMKHATQASIKIQLLELSHYLEHYLWPNFNESTNSNKCFIMSILIMVNEKSKEGLNSFSTFHNTTTSTPSTSSFKSFFENLLKISLSNLTISEQYQFILFFINAFQNVEDQQVRNECLKIISYPIWINLTPGRYQQEILSLSDPLAKKLRLFKKKVEKITDTSSIEIKYSNFLLELMNVFIKNLDKLVELKSLGGDSENYKMTLIYCERFIELMIDLMTQITTRRFFFALVDDFHLILKTQQSEFCSNMELYGEDSKVLIGLLGILKVYYYFDINNFTGEELTRDQATGIHYQQIQDFQKVVFKHFPEIKELSLRNVSFVETKSELLAIISTLSQERLNDLCTELNLTLKGSNQSKQFLIALLLMKYQKRENVVDPVSRVSLYPTEKLLWENGENSGIPNSNYNNDKSLALPKLNLQFLSYNDYLMRNFVLIRLESAYEIKCDIIESLSRLSPQLNKDTGKTTFSGWSRMTLQLSSPFKIISTTPSLIGEIKPNCVTGLINVNTSSCKPHIKEEWLSVKEHDILFLLTIIADPSSTTDKKYIIKHVRGCEVLNIVGNESGSNGTNANNNSNSRAFRVLLDTNQYQEDLENDSLKLYNTFNIVLRRNPKENNFKALLDTIISLFNSKCYLPDWLSSIFLGYPSSIGTTGDEQQTTLSFNDTFLNLDHLKQVYKDKSKIEFSENFKQDGGNDKFKIKFNNVDNSILVSNDHGGSGSNGIGSIIKSENLNKNRNKIQFTEKQVEAITSGMIENKLTLIVGPPGTGKTDIAVQIISNIYHSSPSQRTLIITHSNQALNQLFEKIYKLDINERYLLRLGHGQKQLGVDKDFTKQGRIDFWLNLRINQLARVDQLAKSLSITDDVSYTCDTALHFYSYHILSKWERFQYDLQSFIKSSDGVPSTLKYVNENYPFSKFFLDNQITNVTTTTGDTAATDKQLFGGESTTEEIKIKIQELWNWIENIFKELQECKVFELLKSPNDRFNYLLLNQSKIVAMTCTHAALKRNELVKLGFKFDNLLMEESAQITDIESFIPLQLQVNELTGNERDEGNRLKRVILIGDHNQLPPVVKNQSLSKYSHFDQSLFTRLIRLDMPHIILDRQGRSRSSISELFSWKYKGLKDLDHCLVTNTTATDQQQEQQDNQFKYSNFGLAYDYQLINVEESDGYGIGESEPTPHYYQNLGEAEYICSMYQYLIAIGYKSDNITVLTTYNGQKHLLRDVFKSKCGSSNFGGFYGMPNKITTIDKYQGQQNDIILLSLVRTKQYGHIRDVRRLIVAMSRARLGLYIFCKKQFFQNCYETSMVFSKLLKRPDKLLILKSEQQSTNSSSSSSNSSSLSTRLITSKLDENDCFEIQNSFHMKSLVESFESDNSQ